MYDLKNAVKTIQDKCLTDEENYYLLAIANIIDSNTGSLGGSVLRHSWKPIMRYAYNRRDSKKRAVVHTMAAALTQELGWADWTVNIFRTGKKPGLNLSKLTPEDLNDPTPEQQAALNAEDWNKLDVVEFGGKPMAIAFSSVIHPGLNEIEVVDLDYETNEHFKPAVFNPPYQGKKNTIGHIYIFHHDEGGSFIISEYIPNGTLTEMKISLVTLAFRVEPATSGDHQKITEEFEDRLYGESLNQQIGLALTLESQIQQKIPAILRQTRKKRGWSQTKLGQKLGISQQYVAALESGTRQMTADLQQKFVALLSQSPVADKLEELITGGLDPRDIQRELAAMARQSGHTPRGQLWQACGDPDCVNEPICLNCRLCEEEHCQCDE